MGGEIELFVKSMFINESEGIQISIQPKKKKHFKNEPETIPYHQVLFTI